MKSAKKGSKLKSARRRSVLLDITVVDPSARRLPSVAAAEILEMLAAVHPENAETEDSASKVMFASSSATAPKSAEPKKTMGKSPKGKAQKSQGPTTPSPTSLPTSSAPPSVTSPKGKKGSPKAPKTEKSLSSSGTGPVKGLGAPKGAEGSTAKKSTGMKRRL
jgi:hypothetical protein